jgi:hypothetical protein
MILRHDSREPEKRSEDICSLLGNDSVNAFPQQGTRKQQSFAMQRRCKHALPTIERLCFLRCPCKVVIKKSSEAGRAPHKKKP